jgi:predicted tellurium resistance membrane protein TerC
MTFSQGWDAGFRAILIYVGVVLFWLGLIEPHFADPSTSVTVMNIVAAGAAIAFFVRARRRAIQEWQRAEAEVRALMEEEA